MANSTALLRFKGSTAISAWSLLGPEHFCHSYDWSVPKNSSSHRIITADRDVTAHKDNCVFAVFGDGHVGTIEKVNRSFLNPEVTDDDIYTSSDDGPMNASAGGSATRTFVR